MLGDTETPSEPSDPAAIGVGLAAIEPVDVDESTETGIADPAEAANESTGASMSEPTVGTDEPVRLEAVDPIDDPGVLSDPEPVNVSVELGSTWSADADASTPPEPEPVDAEEAWAADPDVSGGATVP
jgi:hypothetical protein